MPTVSALGTNYNLPNYHGRVHQLTPADTPLTTAIMSASGLELEHARTFEWTTTDLRTAAQNVVVDGDSAGTPENRSRGNVFNVLQTHREDVGVAYERQAQYGQFDGQNVLDGPNVTDEAGFQITQMWKQIKRDIEFSIIQGTYVLPGTNGTAASTRGLLEAISTNAFDPSGDAGTTTVSVTEEDLGDAMQSAWDNGGLQESEMGLLVVNSVQKRWLSKVFVTDKGVEPRSRNVGGVNVQEIETDFGRLGVMLNRYVPQDTILVTSLDQCKLHVREIPGKGIMFAESLGKDGASDKFQLYTSVGLEYGNERSHAKIEFLTTDAPTAA